MMQDIFCDYLFPLHLLFIIVCALLDVLCNATFVIGKIGTAPYLYSNKFTFCLSKIHIGTLTNRFKNNIMQYEGT